MFVRTHIVSTWGNRLSFIYKLWDSSGYESVYKIKLRAAGYRLAYEVNDNEIVIYVIAVGKREKDEVYQKLRDRL